MKRDWFFLCVSLILILCLGFSIAQDYSNMSMADLLDALSDTNNAIALFNDTDELTATRNKRDQVEADLRTQTPHYVLAAAVKLSLENQIDTWQGLYDAAKGLYDAAISDLYVAEIWIGIANIRMQEALQGMQAALKEGNSENYRYWSGVYSHWQQVHSDAEADKADAQSRADTAHTDMIRINIVLGPLKHRLHIHDTFTYNPLEAERNMMLSQLKTLNDTITELETYYRNLELTAQALQAEINKRKAKKKSEN
jgi:hypothetical protein